MAFLELAEKRCSVRKFQKKKVEQEKITQILEAAKLAPTAVNFQPQRILVIQSDDALNKLAGCTPFHFDAPLAFLVCYEEGVQWKRKYDGHSSGEIDASIVGTHMMMAAADLGIGNTWVMNFDPEAIRKAYQIPENYIPVALFPMGYPADDYKPALSHEKSLPNDDMVFYEHF